MMVQKADGVLWETGEVCWWVETGNYESERSVGYVAG